MHVLNYYNSIRGPKTNKNSISSQCRVFSIQSKCSIIFKEHYKHAMERIKSAKVIQIPQRSSETFPCFINFFSYKNMNFHLYMHMFPHSKSASKLQAFISYRCALCGLTSSLPQCIVLVLALMQASRSECSGQGFFSRAHTDCLCASFC